MRFIYAFQLAFFLSISSISFNGNQVFAQSDDFDIGTEDWPDIPLDEPSESFDSDISEPDVVEKPAAKVVEEPQKAVVEKPVQTKPATVAEQPKIAEQPKTPVYTETKPEPKATQKPFIATSSIKRAGPPLVMIARPTYAPYSEEGKTKYISAIAEGYFYFKLGALTEVQIIPQEKMANNIQYYRDFSRRISRASYIEAAKKLGATFLIYHEYEPTGKNLKYNLEVFSIANNEKIYSEKKDIVLSELESGLFECVNDVAVTISSNISDKTNKFLSEDVIGTNSKAIEALGDQIVNEGEYSKKRATAAVPNYEKICNQNPKMHLATFITANAFARAGLFEKAVNYQRKLISTFGSGYPGLYLRIANFYRMEESYNDALDAAEEAKRYEELVLPASAEIAGIYEAKGDLSRAENEYQAILKKGGEDANIYFQLALVSIGLNNLSQVNNYLSKSAAAGRELDRGDYYEIGLRYAELGTANEKAVEAFKNSLGIQQDNEDAWLQLADLYTKMDKQNEAAECYISLFHINNTTYKDYLPKAALIYESLNQTDRAKEAYELFLARKFSDPEVNVRLAKIEAQNNNCRRAVDLVERLDTTSSLGFDIKKIFEQCQSERRPVIVSNDDPAQKGWAAIFAWRMASGLITAAGAGLGYYFNTQLEDTNEKYRVSKYQPDVLKFNNDRDHQKTMRNLCYMGGGVGLASLTASIALPIIFSKN